MKALLYNDSDGLGGIERHICDLAVALPSEGIEPTVICRKSSELERAAMDLKLNVLALSTAKPYTLGASRQLASWVKSRQVDIIHAHNGRAAMISVLAARKAGRGTCVKSQHFLEPAHVTRRGPMSVIARAIHRRVNGAIDAWIAVSEAARSRMLDRGEAPSGKISVVPNGIRDPERSRLTDPAIEREALGIDQHAPMAVCVARLEPEKDIGALVAAWQQVASTLPQARCVIVGAGSQEAALRAQVEQARLNGTVQFAGFRDDALSVINAADLLVLPSIAEPFGLVLLEAMSLSKAVVSTRAGGPSEIVRDGETGLLVPSSNPPALAAALLKLLGDRDLCEHFGRNGRARFTQHFTTQRMARATAGVYRAAIGDGRMQPVVADAVEVI